jgi:Resolvase, N terminal domain
MTAPVRAALYLRVSTGRQAENDLSIADQRRQAKGYCTSRGWEIVADYVEPGVSATDDRRPEFHRMAPRSMKMGTILSPFPYDPAGRRALQWANLRWPAILHHASYAAVSPISQDGPAILR